VPKGILISRDDNSKKYRVTFELPAYNYLELREYPIEAIVLTIVPEEKSEIPDGEYVLIQEGGKILFPVLKLANNWRLISNRA
jgi:hypothetical protein